MTQMESIDSSDMLQRTKAFCAVAVPTLEAKQAAWDKLFSNDKDKEMILTMSNETCMGFRRVNQTDLLDQFKEKFFENIYDCVMKKAKSVSYYIWMFLQPNMQASQEEIDRF